MPQRTDANVKEAINQTVIQNTYPYRIKVKFSDRRSVIQVVYVQKQETTGWMYPTGKK